MTTEPVPKHKIKWTLFKKESGKFAYNGTAEVSCHIWDDSYIPQIIESQSDVVKTAFNECYFLVTDDADDAPIGTFDCCLFMPNQVKAGYTNWTIGIGKPMTAEDKLEKIKNILEFSQGLSTPLLQKIQQILSL